MKLSPAETCSCIIYSIHHKWKKKKFVLDLVRPVYFYPFYFIAHIHWRLLNYSKAVQSSPVPLPRVYWLCVAEMAERDWLSDRVWVWGGRGTECGVKCLPGRSALYPPIPTAKMKVWKVIRQRDAWALVFLVKALWQAFILSLCFSAISLPLSRGMLHSAAASFPLRLAQTMPKGRH